MSNSAFEVLTGLVARMGGMPDVIAEFGLERYLAARMSGEALRGEQQGYKFNREGSENSVAMWQVMGVLSPKPEYWDEISTYRLAESLNAARTDNEITAGLLVIDSPGGYTGGMIELAQAAADFAAVKPLDAQVQGCCCSGAYWLASQCRAIYAGPRDDVGSIGVRSGVMDWSEFLKNLGIEMVSITTGPLKDLGLFGTPMTAEKRAFLQARADAIFADFKEAVQRGRKLSDEQMAAITTGGWWTADQAKQLGLVDGIQSYRATLAGLGTSAAKPTTRSRSMAEVDDAPKAATHKELKAALPEASADFILSQLEASATVSAAQTAYIAHMNAELKAANEAKATAEEKAAQVEATAKANAGKQEPGKPVVGLGGTVAGDSAAAPTDYYELARQYQEKHKCRWSEACLEIKRRHPEAREAMGAPAKPRE
jgi:signal peptide peptidase SppA